jgi:ergothioneine biosynthesis protein EgtB
MKEYEYNSHKLQAEFTKVRNKTNQLCQLLSTEDYVLQTMDDVSPPKWHLGHTTWFFETFLLKPNIKNYQSFNPIFYNIFNSYYEGIGKPFARHHRGFLSRPTVTEIYKYREYIDHYTSQLINTSLDKNIFFIIKLGLQHEQQHQELLLMDIKYNFSHHPEFIIYQNNEILSSNGRIDLRWIEMKKGIAEIGCNNDQFCFDNELPLHEQIVYPYSMAARLVTNEEYCEFIEAGGYQNPAYWLADGWQQIQAEGLIAPLYWFLMDKKWFIYTLSGLKPLNPYDPVVHVNYYEADAYARFKKARLPTESEWEHLVKLKQLDPEEGNFLESNILHPQCGKYQFFGDAWEWTSSLYSPYPGFKPFNGSLSEYNNKFMSNQMVLRGGSCVTPRSHIRATYRNFFQPNKRWQFSGIRLAKNI